MQILLAIIVIIYFSVVIGHNSTNSDMHATKFEMCQKDSKCTYTLNDIPDSKAIEYYKTAP